MKLGLSAEQLAERRLGIGGSDAGAIVAGGDAWHELWLDKTGRKEPSDLSGILAVQMGSFTEPLNAAWYEMQTGRPVSMRNHAARHPGLPYMRANLDGVTQTSAGQPAYIDFKHVGRSGEHLTLRYTAQCTHCAIILSAAYPSSHVDWWVLSTFVGNSRWELTEQEVDPFFAAEYIGRCAEFWRYVERDQEPPLAAPLPVPAPRKLRTVSLEDETRSMWPNWSVEMIDHFAIFSETWELAQRHDRSKDAIKRLLPDDVGIVTRGRVKVARDRANAVRISLTKEKANV